MRQKCTTVFKQHEKSTWDNYDGVKVEGAYLSKSLKLSPAAFRYNYLRFQKLAFGCNRVHHRSKHISCNNTPILGSQQSIANVLCCQLCCPLDDDNIQKCNKIVNLSGIFHFQSWSVYSFSWFVEYQHYSMQKWEGKTSPTHLNLNTDVQMCSTKQLLFLRDPLLQAQCK